MRAGIFFVAFVASVVAQPHKKHQRLHKRDVVTVTETTIATTTAPEVLVIVDPNGNPVMTSTLGQPVATYTPALSFPSSPTFVPVAVSTSSSSSVSTASVSTSSAPASSVPAAVPSSSEAPVSSLSESATSSTTPAPATTPTPSVTTPTTLSSAVSTISQLIGSSPTAVSNVNAGYGISYSPYDASGQCKDQAAVSADIAQMKGYAFVRLYGVDCNQTATVLTGAKAQGMKVFAAIYDLTQVNAGVQQIIDAVNGDWDSIHTVSIGNENVNTGSLGNGQTVGQDAALSAVQGAVSTAKGMLTGAGYSGPVVHVDVYVDYYTHTDLCNIGDYVAANAHPYFAGNSSSGAGDFVKDTINALATACGKDASNIVITETGWPHDGESNNLAVASTADQQAAFKAIRGAVKTNVVLFSAFDDKWKVNNAGTFGTEQFWGFLDS